MAITSFRGRRTLALLGLALVCGPALAAVVDVSEAVVLAEAWLQREWDLYGGNRASDPGGGRTFSAETCDVQYLTAGGKLSAQPPPDGKILAYVVTFASGGYAVLTADDRLEPLLAFDTRAVFRWDEPERNFLRHVLTTQSAAHWRFLEQQLQAGLSPDVQPTWRYLRDLAASRAQPAGEDDERAIYVYWDTASWDQYWPYNVDVIAHNGSIPGIPTGCTATAMAILTRFHRWPHTGDGSHSYYDLLGAVRYWHSVDYGATTYDWGSMPTGNLTQFNAPVSELMYQCGVAVNMDYEVGNSGAWPSPEAMNSHFRYRTTSEQWSSHAAAIIASIRGGLPTILSTTVHTVVACGYRDSPSPYYYVNAGWSGSDDGWYNLDDPNFPGSDPTVDRSYPYCAPRDYVYVDTGALASGSGEITDPYDTLATGYAEVPSDGVLWLKAGHHTGQHVFSKPLVVRSYNGDAVVEW
jgi:hypothetical protein